MITDKKFVSYTEELRKKYGRISLGAFLMSWRTAEGLTQVKFARKLGLSPANLCDIEQGRRIPSPGRALKIAKKLGLPEKGIIVMAIEDALEKNGLSYTVELKEVA